jgi:nitric-oxide synthase
VIRGWRHLLPRSGTDTPVAGSPLARRLRRLSPLERIEEAYDFHRQFCDAKSIGAKAARQRWAEIRSGLLRHGHYEHTPEELTFGARVAWRNHARCIGRLFWSSLVVFDRREVRDVDEMAEAISAHLAFAVGDGRIRSAISIFPPVMRGVLPAHVESAQVTQYAGHVDRTGRVTGDRQNTEATRIAKSLGWRPPEIAGRFDLLPMILRDEHDRRVLAELPQSQVKEVSIAHPDCPDIAALGLRWYAVPVVSNMILTIGGIDYPCAPFNGFYMSTEIASRNFADRNRYDLLPEVARALGLFPGGRPTQFWQDTALTELNRAVVHSYDAAGVTLIDHHSASDQFMEFVARETSRGRRVAADWSWIVPPQASAACEVFHLPMHDFGPVPNYYRGRAEDGRELMPFHGNRLRTRVWSRIDAERRRWKLRQRES